MNKFEGIKLVHLESSDYVGEELSPAVEREIDTADIVIDGGTVVKNRVSQAEHPGAETGGHEENQETTRDLISFWGSVKNIALAAHSAIGLAIPEADRIQNAHREAVTSLQNHLQGRDVYQLYAYSDSAQNSSREYAQHQNHEL
ncbi:hypothetical protein ACE09S_003857 [Salmonella enterica]